jgi:hypothetical protein
MHTWRRLACMARSLYRPLTLYLQGSRGLSSPGQCERGPASEKSILSPSFQLARSVARLSELVHLVGSGIGKVDVPVTRMSAKALWY